MWQGLIVDHIDGPLGSHDLLNGVNVDGAAPSDTLAVMQVDQDTWSIKEEDDENICTWIAQLNILISCQKRKELV